MKRCITCNGKLWVTWLIISWPWVRRVKKFKDAIDCIDLLPYNIFCRDMEEPNG
uniref:Uncharacterized protein n=1 Tax=viral metagenome TaxID=1070528 RepID=A0A6M3K9P6_9ZZZZ